MASKPGSFSKNFGWDGGGGGKGLIKLHTCINDGFARTLKPVDRNLWRKRAGLANGLDLIPPNFFLYNKNGQLLVDELAFQAIQNPHSLLFDRLALFSFHFNNVGSGITGTRNPSNYQNFKVIQNPVDWANNFVKECLWENSRWNASALNSHTLDLFLEKHLDATKAVRVKCRNNYRYLFELCAYFSGNSEHTEVPPSSLVSCALYLVWDRSLYGGNSGTEGSLLDEVHNAEVWKLLGASKSSITTFAKSHVKNYLRCGGINRFDHPVYPVAPINLGWVDQKIDIVEDNNRNQTINNELGAGLRSSQKTLVNTLLKQIESTNIDRRLLDYLDNYRREINIEDSLFNCISLDTSFRIISRAFSSDRDAASEALVSAMQEFAQNHNVLVRQFPLYHDYRIAVLHSRTIGLPEESYAELAMAVGQAAGTELVSERAAEAINAELTQPNDEPSENETAQQLENTGVKKYSVSALIYYLQKLFENTPKVVAALDSFAKFLERIENIASTIFKYMTFPWGAGDD